MPISVDAYFDSLSTDFTHTQMLMVQYRKYLDSFARFEKYDLPTQWGFVYIFIVLEKIQSIRNSSVLKGIGKLISVSYSGIFLPSKVSWKKSQNVESQKIVSHNFVFS